VSPARKTGSITRQMESSSDCTAERMVTEELIARCWPRGSCIANFGMQFTPFLTKDVRFSNRPVGVKRFQAISHYLSDDPLLQCRCRSRARASLRNRHQGPSIMGFEDEAEQSV